MEIVVRAIERVTGSIGLAASLLIIPLILATGFEVFSRYLFGAPTMWAFELGYILTGTHFILGGAIALMKGSHVRIDLIYGNFSRRRKAAVDLFFYLFLFLPFLVLLSNSLLTYALRSFASGERTGQSAWNPPIWPFRMLITLGFILLALQVVAEIVKCIAVLRGKPIAEKRGG
jgi:TRAP-type mannitol/chloroaromatic compound transport system permease small subunit